MTITAKVVADSTFQGSRLTTFVLSYPRFIHSEFMTHRVFSRNASSSRAIPVSTMIGRALNHTAMPHEWGTNQKGMQPGAPLEADKRAEAEAIWRAAAYSACTYAQKLSDLGVHKQIVNRLIENFQSIEVVVSSTQWANFYALRSHKDAQADIQELARIMMAAHTESVPTALRAGDWHLPFITDDDVGVVDPSWLPKISAARCARVSYLKHDRTQPTPSEDIQLFNRLLGGDPKHASPAEHQARATEVLTEGNSNFGPWWQQYRKTIGGENIAVFAGF